MDLRVRDVARLLNVSEQTVYRWARKGSLPAHRVHDQYLFNRVALQEWAALHKHRVSPELFTPNGTADPAPGLHAALERGGIVHDSPGERRGEILAAPRPDSRRPASGSPWREVVSLVLSWISFSAPPAILSALLAICLGWAAWLVQRAATPSLPPCHPERSEGSALALRTRSRSFVASLLRMTRPGAAITSEG